MIIELSECRDRTAVFEDREHAGAVLAELLESFRGSDAIILAIPAGGVPVGKKVAQSLGLEWDLAVVSKITLPWNTESGYGAVAFNGAVELNQRMIADLGLSDEVVAEGIQKTKYKVTQRVRELRGQRPWPDLAGRAVILIDDGLASGFTMMTAVRALGQVGAGRISVAVPTAPIESCRWLSTETDAVYCANIRRAGWFAVADAYQNWHDLSPEELAKLAKE